MIFYHKIITLSSALLIFLEIKTLLLIIMDLSHKQQNSEQEELAKLTEKELFEIKYFTYENYVTSARFCRIHDGDSFSAVFYINSKLVKHVCRLNGIDTPEINSKVLKEKNLAIQARDYLADKLRGKVLQIRCGKFDKYGRLLVDIFENDVNISDKMVELGLAKVYKGGKKDRWIF